MADLICTSVGAGASAGSSISTRVPSPSRLSIRMAPPSASTTLREIARPRPVPVRFVVKYGSKTCGRSAGGIPGPRSATHRTTPPRSSPRAPTSISSPLDRPRGGQALAGVRDQVDEDAPQPLAVGDDRARGRARARSAPRRRPLPRGRPAPRPAPGRERPPAPARAGGAARSRARRPRCGRGAPPRGRCRPPPRGPPPAAPSRFRLRSDPLMIISGLRTSWAITVDRRPSAESRSRRVASRWKRAIESVRAPKVRATSRASSSSQGRPGPRERPRSPVAAILFIASVRAASGRVTVRARAQLRSSPRPTATRAATARAARSAESGRSASARERSTRTRGAPSPAPSAVRQGHVLLAVQVDPRHPRAPRRPPAGPRRGGAAASRRRRAPPSPPPRGCRSARAGAPRTRRRGRSPARGGRGPRGPRRRGRSGRRPSRGAARPPPGRAGRASVQPAASAPSETSVRPSRSVSTSTSERTRSR